MKLFKNLDVQEETVRAITHASQSPLQHSTIPATTVTSMYQNFPPKIYFHNIIILNNFQQHTNVSVHLADQKQQTVSQHGTYAEYVKAAEPVVKLQVTTDTFLLAIVVVYIICKVKTVKLC